MGAAPTSGAAPAGGVLVLSAGAGALAAGVPLLVMPAPLVAAAGLALFHESGLLRDYAVFVAAALLTGGWFVHHHFWFLQVRAAARPRRGDWGMGLGRRAPGARCGRPRRRRAGRWALRVLPGAAGCSCRYRGRAGRQTPPSAYARAGGPGRHDAAHAVQAAARGAAARACAAGAGRRAACPPAGDRAAAGPGGAPACIRSSPAR